MRSLKFWQMDFIKGKCLQVESPPEQDCVTKQARDSSKDSMLITQSSSPILGVQGRKIAWLTSQKSASRTKEATKFRDWRELQSSLPQLYAKSGKWKRKKKRKKRSICLWQKNLEWGRNTRNVHYLKGYYFLVLLFLLLSRLIYILLSWFLAIISY